MELEEKVEEFRRKGLGVAGISYDSVEILKHFSERVGISYPLLSDTGSKTIRAFGILNEQVPKDSRVFGIPHPVTYVVGPSGEVVSKYAESDYRQRYTASNILVRQFGATADSARTESETEHLKLTSSASSGVVRPGQRIVLALEVEMKARMHVYAPGVQGYIPVEWRMEPSDGWVSHEVEYPEALTLHLAAIRETVPVFKGQIQIVRDLTVGPSDKVRGLLTPEGELVVAGSFVYQACDDTKCYVPRSVPLTWKLRVEGHDRQRAPAELQRNSRSRP